MTPKITTTNCPKPPQKSPKKSPQNVAPGAKYWSSPILDRSQVILSTNNNLIMEFPKIAYKIVPKPPPKSP
jgi:hypothetical protein